MLKLNWNKLKPKFLKRENLKNFSVSFWEFRKHHVFSTSPSWHKVCFFQFVYQLLNQLQPFFQHFSLWLPFIFSSFQLLIIQVRPILYFIVFYCDKLIHIVFICVLLCFIAINWFIMYLFVFYCYKLIHNVFICVLLL